MRAEPIFIDPALLIWDTTDFPRREHVYWGAVSEILRIFDLLDDLGLEVIMSGELAELLISNFPINEIGEKRAELRDFSRTVYGFLSSVMGSASSFPDVVPDTIEPDVINRIQFCDEVRYELRRALSYAVNRSAQAIFSHNVVLDCPGQVIEIRHTDVVTTLPCLITDACYEAFALSKQRIYEENEKHNKIYGFGTRLPSCLTHGDMQELLNSAMAIEGADYLCAYSEKANIFLVFRPHHKNLFHGYPEASDVLEKRGISIAKIPRC